MIERVRVAVVGVGNNTSALVQGINFYRATGSLTGLCRPHIEGLGVGDVEVVAAFAMSDAKVGADLHDAIFAPPNNFPRIGGELPPSGVTVQRGLTGADGIERIAEAVRGAEVVLYSAPSGRAGVALAYAEAALAAKAAFVNTTADPVARHPELLHRFSAAGVPLIGDDLASQFGTSVLHHALLRLLDERGLTLDSSYQVNLGGTEDFRNLVDNPESKLRSKTNGIGTGRVAIAPLGYLPHLGAEKVAHLNIEARGWAGTSVSVDVRLKVNDPSGAAGVNIDLVRLAALVSRRGRGGFPAEAAGLLKSPPGTAV
ncbi:inositol-3-phosphate synthase [Actinoplanes sp. SE50]|uniref:inositol-3-phosphate synthase n=1 Tax=unclassified Actinoplanes TaxID=2626549 RepID=UPI00023ED26A|nr:MULTISPECIES: inositol-3-phosphate synthase [unclassified Actinoplanes]AEV85562.1 myo-inositol-1-phosphate synthase [Actinoplanes sp. SE50/110]ATO83955.1 inositol-3-phosphate synthase [Actinoplanes sp. SE50]SLM01365.1 inositol-3-phosphate synthase [Actinoplanes sp. SE50/110]